MTVLLSYSTNLSASDFATISSTGGVKSDSVSTDSVLIAYSDLRKVNAKLIELKYEKEINEHLRAVIVNDSIAIDGLRSELRNINITHKRDIKRFKRERNVAGGIGIGAIILLIISIL